MLESMRACRCSRPFEKIAGAGHGGPDFQGPVARAMVLAFLDEHLKPRPAGGER